MSAAKKPSETAILRVVDNLFMSTAFDSLRRRAGEGLKVLSAEDRDVLKHVKARHFNQPRMVKGVKKN